MSKLNFRETFCIIIILDSIGLWIATMGNKWVEYVEDIVCRHWVSGKFVQSSTAPDIVLRLRKRISVSVSNTDNGQGLCLTRTDLEIRWLDQTWSYNQEFLCITKWEVIHQGLTVSDTWLGARNTEINIWSYDFIKLNNWLKKPTRKPMIYKHHGHQTNNELRARDLEVCSRF